jgi:hypothetical protein
MIVIADSAVPLPNGPSVPYVYPAGPLPRIIRDECREVATIGQFRILTLQTAQ